MVFALAGTAHADPAWWRELPADLDWERVAGVATAERAASEVLRAFRAPDAPPLPAALARRLRPVAMVSDFRQHVLEARLGDVLDVLEQGGIQPVLLKGAALVATVYGAFERRPMDDVDLLVDPRDAARAAELLLAAGWAWDEATPTADRYERHHHLRPLVDTTRSALHLEIHRELFAPGHPFALTGDEVREASVVVCHAGRAVRVPSPVHQVLHTALHFSWSHAAGFGTWRTVRDLAALTASGRIDWPAVVTAARATRGATGCYWAFHLARLLGGVPVPDEVLAALAPALPRPLHAGLTRHFLQLTLHDQWACPSIALQRAFWTLAMQPGRSGHGASRPWTAGVEPEMPAPAAPPSIRERLASRRRRLRRWVGFAATLLRPSLSVVADSSTALPE